MLSSLSKKYPPSVLHRLHWCWISSILLLDEYRSWSLDDVASLLRWGPCYYYSKLKITMFLDSGMLFVLKHLVLLLLLKFKPSEALRLGRRYPCMFWYVPLHTSYGRVGFIQSTHQKGLRDVKLPRFQTRSNPDKFWHHLSRQNLISGIRPLQLLWSRVETSRYYGIGREGKIIKGISLLQP